MFDLLLTRQNLVPFLVQVGQNTQVIVNSNDNLQLLSKGTKIMKKREVLTPKNFLKQPNQRQKYQCMICYEVCIKPVRCKGNCARIFCMKCVSDTRNVLDRCPSRCSSPFLVSSIPDIEVEFFCPYNPTECKLLIKSLKTFQEHYKCCQYVSSQELSHKKLQNQYKCLKDHYLQFFVGSYQQMINSKCVQCQEQKLCRSFCRICEEFYCVGCRIPPCSKGGCPIGHPYNFQRTSALNYICDICGVSTAVSNDGVYDDNICNFGLCQACFSQLPAQFDQSKPRAIIANINTDCSCTHKLMQINSIHIKNSCQLCKKVKECPKGCLNCNKTYCVGCKLFDIYVDRTCSLDHELIKVRKSQYEAFIQIENQYGCMKCGKTSDQFHFDRQCLIRLCQSCVQYSMKVTTDKERPIPLTCDKNHVFVYLPGEDDYEQTCCKCGKHQYIRLFCQYCDETQRAYCFQCRPIPLQTCYFKHKLKTIVLQKERKCHFCRKESKTLQHCKKCYFYVCQDCVKLTLNIKQPIQEQSQIANCAMQVQNKIQFLNQE